MNVEPIGMPAPMKAWRERDLEPVLRIHCGADPACGAEVGAVYRSPRGVVVESRISVPQERRRTLAPTLDLADIRGVDLSGLLDGFGPSGPAGESVDETVRAQVDLLNSTLYWQDPVPVCPRHGELRVEKAGLAAAVRDAQATYAAPPA